MQSRAAERIEIKKIYDLVEQYHLYGKLRWLPSINKRETGEVYRIIADSRGVFVQPVLYEAFGLTILEAMISGLPTFGTMHRGPSEIIEYGKSRVPHKSSQLHFIIECDCLIFKGCKIQAIILEKNIGRRHRKSS